MTTHARPVARCAGRARERGVSMLEVLIAVVLISIGMLGIAAMQVTGLKNNANANLRAHASHGPSPPPDLLRTRTAPPACATGGAV